LGRGGAILEEEVKRLRKSGARALPGDAAFKLSDPYGFPLDLSEDLLKAAAIEVARAGFEKAMTEQRARAREAQKAAAPGAEATELRTRRPVSSRFVGDFVYEHESEVLAVFVGGREVDEAREGTEASVVVAETPFYAES